MLFKKVLNSKTNNKGMSLVEVVCAIAILGLTTTVITSAMKVGMQSYDRGIQETDLQKDAQLLVNQISDLVIDSSSEVSFDAGTSTLTVKQGSREFYIRYDVSTQKLYYSDTDNPGVEQILADGVSSFGIDADEFAKTGNLGIAVGFVSEDGTRDFNCNYTVTCRNGNGTSSAVVARPHIVAPDSIIIEPKQSLPLSRGISVTGATSTLRYEILSGHGEVAGTTIDGSGNLVCSPDQKDDFWIRVTTNTGGGVAEDSKDICMHVRRVNDIEISGGYDSSSSSPERTAGARYELYAEFPDIQYPDKDNFSVYDDDYIDPYQIQWVVVSGNATISPHGSNNRMCTVTLGADISGTNAVKIMAVSKHAGGTNKAGSGYDTVTDTFELTPSYIYMPNEGGGILRMDHRPQAALVGGTDGVDGLKASFEAAGYTNVTWRFSFKYKQDAPGAVESDWIYSGDVNGWSDADGSMYINLRGAILTLMDRDHGYDIWVRFQIVDASTNNVLWPTASDPVADALYITHGYMEKFGCKFNSVELGLNGARTNYDPAGNYPVLSFRKGDIKENVLELSWPSPFLGYDETGTALTNKICYKVQKLDGGTWKDATGVWCQNDSPSCKMKFDNDNFDGTYRILTYASEMPRYIVNGSGQVVQDGNDRNVAFYTDEYIEGVFYFQARQLR